MYELRIILITLVHKMTVMQKVILLRKLLDEVSKRRLSLVPDI